MGFTLVRLAIAHNHDIFLIKINVIRCDRALIPIFSLHDQVHAVVGLIVLMDLIIRRRSINHRVVQARVLRVIEEILLGYTLFLLVNRLLLVQLRSARRRIQIVPIISEFPTH